MFFLVHRVNKTIKYTFCFSICVIDIIAIGDVTEDVFVQVGKISKVHKKGRNQHLDFKFGTKLGIDKVDKLIGGNAGNVAIGGSRLGLKTALYAEVGADTQGDLLYQSLKDNNVSCKYFMRKKGEKTNYSVVLVHNVERTILVHHEHRSYNFPKLEKSKWIYLTSMAKGSEKIFTPLLRHLAKSKAKLAFNPGTYQLNLGLTKLKPILKKTNVISLNVEETQRLLKLSTRNIKTLAKKLFEQGPEIVLITDGPKGSYCYDGTQFWFCPIYDVPKLERTGCGDSFTTAFVSSLCYNNTIPDALKWGTINSASVIQRIGPQEGLIKKPFLTKILKSNPRFSARTSSFGRSVYKPVKYSKW